MRCFSFEFELGLEFELELELFSSFIVHRSSFNFISISISSSLIEVDFKPSFFFSFEIEIGKLRSFHDGDGTYIPISYPKYIVIHLDSFFSS